MAGRGKQTFWNRGVTAALALFGLFSGSVVRKLVGAGASAFADRFIAVLPALLRGDHRLVRAEFLSQIVAASCVLCVLRKGPWSHAKTFVAAYAVAVIAFYVFPAFTTGAPVPICDVTGQPLRETGFLVMSFALMALCDSRDRTSAAYTYCLTGVLLTLQVLAVTGSADKEWLNVAVSAVGVFCALRFAYEMRDVLSPIALFAFCLYSATLPLRPEITSEVSALTPIYYGIMNLKFVAIGEIAGMLATRKTLKKRDRDEHRNTFWRAEPATLNASAAAG
jgi:hypothetical protein